MSTKIIGKLDSWEDADLGGNDFMTLDEGSNLVRVVTSPYQFYVVWTVDASGQKRKVRSAVKGCPLVQRGEKAQARWYLGVLDRKKEGKPSILEIGPQIFKQILGLSKMDVWGDPKEFDIDIKRQPKGSQPLYIVSPIPHKALSADETGAITEFEGRVDFVKMTEPPTPEQVREMVGLPAEEAVSSASVSSDFGSLDTATGDDDVNFDDDF